jgi:hypothetical protein
MSEAATNVLIFFVLPVVFLLVWGWCYLYIRRVNARMRQLAGEGHTLASLEAGLASVTLEKERLSGKTANA